MFLYYWGRKIEKEQYNKEMLTNYEKLVTYGNVEIKKLRAELGQQGDDTSFDDIPTRSVD